MDSFSCPTPAHSIHSRIYWGVHLIVILINLITEPLEFSLPLVLETVFGQLAYDFKVDVLHPLIPLHILDDGAVGLPNQSQGGLHLVLEALLLGRERQEQQLLGGLFVVQLTHKGQLL